MDTLTYVVVAGWVLMYFMPTFVVAFSTATALAFLAAFDGAPMVMADLQSVAIAVAPVAFVAIFMAWPLSAFIRRLKIWLRGDTADA